MAEWLVEAGIGETRALLVEGEKVLAAKLRWPGELFAGQTIAAKLASRAAGASRGTAITGDGAEILLDRLPREIAEGSDIRVQVTRAAIAERGRFKRAQGRLADPEASAPDTFAGARTVARFAPDLWEGVWHAAWTGEVAFAGGSLIFSVTPAMIVVDVDGSLRSTQLALAAVEPLAHALRQFECGGSIGIDFPSLQSKSDRKAVDAALESALEGWPHERTAMNGFGFVQIAARLDGPSLLHRMQTAPVAAAARMALRRAELCTGTGRILSLTVHPALEAMFEPAWLDELARRTGKAVRVECDPAVAIEAAHAQMVE